MDCNSNSSWRPVGESLYLELLPQFSCHINRTCYTSLWRVDLHELIFVDPGHGVPALYPFFENLYLSIKREFVCKEELCYGLPYFCDYSWIWSKLVTLSDSALLLTTFDMLVEPVEVPVFLSRHTGPPHERHFLLMKLLLVLFINFSMHLYISLLLLIMTPIMHVLFIYCPIFVFIFHFSDAFSH